MNIRTVTACLAMLALGACGATRQASNVGVERTGFLGDAYALLEPGDPALLQPLERFVNDSVDWSAYDSVIVDAVEVWNTGGASVPQEDLITLANYMRAAIIREVGQDLTIVEQPGPTTLRFSPALVRADAANQTMTAVSSVAPPAIVLSSAYEYLTDRPSWQGQAAAEFMVTNSQTEELYAATRDRRVGGRTLESASTRWTDVERIIDFWAELMRYRLCELQERTSCVRPAAAGAS